MRILTIAALAVLSLNSYAVEYTPDTNVDYDIIQMHDTTTWEKVCQSYDSTCDVPEGTYQVKLFDRNWNVLELLRDVSVRDSDSDGVHAPDLTAEVCALYQVLDDQSLLGSLSIPAICTTIYSVGDSGPGGGIVFYVTNGGRHGLEAAPEDQGLALWCASVTELGAAGTAIGTGVTNTEAILEGCPVAGNAAEVASSYNGGGFEDWFLPSKDELNTMSVNIGRFCDTTLNPDCNVGGFAGRYWSSSEYVFQLSFAWFQNFGCPPSYDCDGAREIWFPLNVRAVRAF